MSEFEHPENPDLPTPLPPQEKRIGFLLLAFLIGLGFGMGWIWFASSKATKLIQAEAVKEGHAVYKVVDEFGRTKFEWLPAHTEKK